MHTTMRLAMFFVFGVMNFILLFPSAALSTQIIPIIDAHSQVDLNTDIEKVVPLTDKADVAATILSTRFERSSKDVVDYTNKYPGRIIPAFKTKTRAFMKRKALPSGGAILAIGHGQIST